MPNSTIPCRPTLAKRPVAIPWSVGATPSAAFWRAPGVGRCGLAPDLAGLRVCFIAGTLGQGGAERQLYYFVRALRNSGSRVRVLSLGQGEFWESKIVQ